MRYKTITLELLQDRPAFYDQLISNQTLLSTLERLAEELRTYHHAWQDLLLAAKPGSDPSQIASEAMELAIQQLVELLPSEYPAVEMQPLTLDAAMAFISRHSPPA
jgi:hypothetical protein